MLSAPSSSPDRQIEAEIPKQAGPRFDSKPQARQEQLLGSLQIVDLYPGMFWTVDGANAITALRGTQFSNRLEDYRRDRAVEPVSQKCHDRHNAMRLLLTLVNALLRDQRT